jgi:tripartite-type tricarboxylate transporter receptor subunit TctC
VPHLLGVEMGKEMGIQWTHVPYRGLALAMNDLAAGVVSAVVSTLTETLEPHKAGRVRILATAGEERSSFVEGIPTFKESGIDVDLSLWFGAYARTGTPAAMLDRLRTALTTELRAPALKQKFTSLGLVPAPNTPAEQLAFQQRETAMWGRVVKESGFTPED